MDKKEAMDILGLSDDMAENIQRSYIRLSRENHPDRGGDPEVFKRIQDAYDRLSSIEAPAENRSESLELHVQVSLEEAVFGVVLETHVRPTVVSRRPMIGDGKASANATVLTVVERIPPLALLKCGSLTFSHGGESLNGSPRTVNMTYSVRPHERYRPHPEKSRGMLEVDEPVPVTTALYGGTVEVKTLYGIRKLYIRPGTNVGDLYELRGHGPLGSLMVRVSALEMPVIHDLDSSSDAQGEKILREIMIEEEEIRKNRDFSKNI
jgi:DnaJ-class molecular chaperone